RGQRSGLASKREQKPFWRGREGSARPKCRSRAGFQASGAGLESWPGARKLALSLWRADSPAAGTSVALGGSAMQLSRFVVKYDHVRPGEHVLYSVLEDRYAGIDDRTAAALSRWSRGEPAADDDEREAQEVLLDDGFLVDSREADDEGLRAYLDKAREGM